MSLSGCQKTATCGFPNENLPVFAFEVVYVSVELQTTGVVVTDFVIFGAVVSYTFL